MPECVAAVDRADSFEQAPPSSSRGERTEQVGSHASHTGAGVFGRVGVRVVARYNGAPTPDARRYLQPSSTTCDEVRRPNA